MGVEDGVMSRVSGIFESVGVAVVAVVESAVRTVGAGAVVAEELVETSGVVSSMACPAEVVLTPPDGT
jgi:hypothetical protein